MTVYLLHKEPLFPPVEDAEPDGLIAIGGDLSVERIILAYSQGIFPWFMEEGDVYWYSPDPRMVLFPEKFHKSESLDRILKSGKFSVRIDSGFEDVIRACASTKRADEAGTWINESFTEAYHELYRRGLAHSVETYYGNELVGGLYGVSLGAAFFGESMFFKMPNASKVAFAALVEFCLHHGLTFIDCQVETSHLRSLGASTVSRTEYLKLLEKALT
ncbi:MAG: leucyl/phenylalanyl-tRNA--protein transferase [Bacteroidetes bacterium]|nr:leucyl/phenylalanyl-tRNA--protein transferase [Bacteroidota bacterium]